MEPRQAEVFGEWLSQKEMEWRLEAAKQGRGRVTAIDFADWLEIPPTTYGGYANGHNLPSPTNLAKIAEKLGPDAYDAAGRPPAMPSDWRLRLIAKNWHKLSDEEKDKLVRQAKKEGNDETDPPQLSFA